MVRYEATPRGTQITLPLEDEPGVEEITNTEGTTLREQLERQIAEAEMRIEAMTPEARRHQLLVTFDGEPQVEGHTPFGNALAEESYLKGRLERRLDELNHRPES